MVTISIDITEAEFKAIALVGSEEMRTVKQQVRYLVAQEMIRRGLLKSEDLHDYAETLIAAEWDRKEEKILAEETLEDLIGREKYKPEKVEEYFAEGVAEKKSPPFDLPPQYRGGKETLYWKVFNLFAQHPTQTFTRSDVMEGLQLEDRQVASPLQRLLARNLVEVVEKILNEEGKEVSVYQLTQAALQLIEERNKELYG